MKLIYSGKTKEFTPDLEEKIGGKLAKLSKMIEQRGEREANIAHRVERFLHVIKIKMNFHDHAIVGEGTDADLETALYQAVGKLETQTIELKKKWLDTHRGSKALSLKEGLETAPLEKEKPAVKSANGAAGATNRKPKVFRVNIEDGRKPMTLEEALIEAESEREYLVFRDPNKPGLSILVRRPDGHFDLIEP